MPEYTPDSMPEITVFYGYLPAEYERGLQAVPADVEFTDIEINGGHISMSLKELLLETHGDDWAREIIRDLESKRRVA